MLTGPIKTKDIPLIFTLFMMATIPGSAASRCILFKASDGGGFNYQEIVEKFI